MPSLPPPRGPLTELLLDALVQDPLEANRLLAGADRVPFGETGRTFEDEDLQLALYLCYELHYRGLSGVSEDWEWEPSLLAFRHALEQRFERALLDRAPLDEETVAAEDMDLALRAIAESEGPSLSAYIRAHATIEQVREFMVHRSAYQLKEADPHSWAIPRLSGPPKAALIEIQIDEYGRGRSEWMHAELFARAMRAVGLNPDYGAYLGVIPGITLATVNLMSLLGLHRRWRGAVVGHLALFEMSSSIPNRRYGDGLRRLGYSGDATLFFDEHVVADAVHENIAAVDLAGGLVRQDPTLCSSILWGARALSHLDCCWAAHVLGHWECGRTSLLRPLDATAFEPALASR